MSTTPARRARRAPLQAEHALAEAARLKMKSNDLIISQMRSLYKEDPNKALEFCFAVVGKDQFQAALKKYLSRTLADVAFVLALKRCLTITPEPKAPPTIH